MNALEELDKPWNSFPTRNPKKMYRNRWPITSPPCRLSAQRTFRASCPRSWRPWIAGRSGPDAVQRKTGRNSGRSAQVVQRDQTRIQIRFGSGRETHGLKSFLARSCIHPPAKRCRSRYEELLNVGLLEEVPQGVQKGENSSLMAQVEQLITQPDRQPPDSAGAPEISRSAESVVRDGRTNCFSSSLTRSSENLSNPALVVRDIVG